MALENWFFRSMIIALMTIFVARVWADSMSRASVEETSRGSIAAYVNSSEGLADASK